MHVEESGVIDRPAEKKVFNYVADPVNLPKWSGAAKVAAYTCGQLLNSLLDRPLRQLADLLT